MNIRPLALAHIIQGITEAVHNSILACIAFVGIAIDIDAANWCNNRSGASTKGFHLFTCCKCIFKFLPCYGSCLCLNAQFGSQVQQAIASYAVQNSTAEGRGEEAAIPIEHKVH